MKITSRPGVVALLLVLVFAACSGNDEPKAKSSDTTTTTKKAAFDREADNLLRLLDDVRSLTFHAVYSATNAANSTFEIQIWRKAGKIRQDINATGAEGAAVLQRAIVKDGKTTLCSKTGEDPWQCQGLETTSEQSESDAVFGAVRDQLSGLDVTTRSETIEGRSVTCFAWQAEDEESKGEMCVLNSGLPVRATVGATTLTLVTEQSDVSDDAFTPPAPTT